MEQSRSIFVLSFLLLFFPRGQYSQSPCPENFEYKTDDSGTYGLVHVYPKNRVSSITTVVNFTVAAQLPSRYVGKLDSMGENLALIQQFNRGAPIDYRLDFPVTSPLPRITTITVNGDVVCSGPGDKVRGQTTVTTVGLEHTLYLNNPGVVYNETPKPTKPGPVTFMWGNQGNQNVPSFDFSNPTWTTDFDNFYIINKNPGFNRLPDGETFDISSIFNRPATATVTQAPARRPPPKTTTPAAEEWPEPNRSQNHNECGTKDIERVPLIYSGMSYERGDWPWVVAIFTQKDVSIGYVCSGTIISTLHVLTAAHCIYRRESTIRLEDVVVKAGVYNLKKAFGDDDIAVSRFIASAIKHELFNRVTLANDIMLLKFTRPLEFNTYIKAACLWSGSPDINLIAGNIGVVTGWGVSESEEAGKGKPRMLRMPVISTDKCRASKQEFHSLTSNTTLCAGDRNGSGPCLGDSGGGLYLPNQGHWSLRGIVSLSLQSMGERACNLHEYVVFTDSAQYIPWINENMTT